MYRFAVGKWSVMLVFTGKKASLTSGIPQHSSTDSRLHNPASNGYKPPFRTVLARQEARQSDKHVTIADILNVSVVAEPIFLRLIASVECCSNS
jgi:hypothetical protein